jgi:hypothetical protein
MSIKRMKWISHEWWLLCDHQPTCSLDENHVYSYLSYFYIVNL